MNLNQVIRRTLTTEKISGGSTGSNQYGFEVNRKANKRQISLAVEDLFGVKVLSVRHVTGKNLMRKTGRRKLPKMVWGIKKAVVTIKSDQTITLKDYKE